MALDLVRNANETLALAYSSLNRERKVHSNVYVLHKTLNLFLIVVSQRYQNVKCTSYESYSYKLENLSFNIKFIALALHSLN